MDDSIDDAIALTTGQLFDALVGTSFDISRVQPIVRKDVLSEITRRGCDPKNEPVAVEIWEKLSVMCERSFAIRGLCIEQYLTRHLLPLLAKTDNDRLAELLLKIFRLLSCYGMSIPDMLALLKLVQNDDGYWCRSIVSILRTLRDVFAYNLCSPSHFFLNHDKHTGVAVPPMKCFPAYGYSFVTWIRLEPSSDIDQRGKDAPVLYSFLTSKGLGFSARFDAAFRLVVSALGNKGRLDSETITFKKNFPVFEWIMVAVVHTRGRFLSKSTVSLYIDGIHEEKVNLKYPSVPDALTSNALGEGLQGQLGTVLLFNDTLVAVAVRAIHDKGPNHLDAFDDPDAVDTLMGSAEMKVLYDGTLKRNLVFSYNAKACEKRLCLNTSVGTPADWFVTVPHATLMNGTTPVAMASLDDCLKAVGGVQMLIPLCAQLDQPIRPKQGQSVQYNVDTELLKEVFCAISDMLTSSHMHQHQMVLSHGFVVVGYLLKQAFPLHLTETLMSHMLDLGRRLLRQYNTGCGEDAKQLAIELYRHIILRGELWIFSSPHTQIRLYSEVAADVVPLAANQWPGLPPEIVNAGLVLDIVRDYYWLVPPEKNNKMQVQLIRHPVTGGIIGERPVASDVAVIRSYLLLVIRHTTTRGGRVAVGREDVRGLLSLLIVSHGVEGQVLDVLQLFLILCTRVASPDTIFASFYDLNGLSVVLNVLAITESETVKLYCIKVLGLYATWVKKHRRNEYENMFYVLSVKLDCSVNIYIALYELMTNQISTQVLEDFSHWDGVQGILRHAPALETQFLLLKKLRDSIQEKRYHLIYLVHEGSDRPIELEDIRRISRLQLPDDMTEPSAEVQKLVDDVEREAQVSIKVTIQLLNDVLNMVGNQKANMTSFLDLIGWQNWLISILRWAMVECEASEDLRTTDVRATVHKLNPGGGHIPTPAEMEDSDGEGRDIVESLSDLDLGSGGIPINVSVHDNKKQPKGQATLSTEYNTRSQVTIPGGTGSRGEAGNADPFSQHSSIDRKKTSGQRSQTPNASQQSIDATHRRRGSVDHTDTSQARLLLDDGTQQHTRTRARTPTRTHAQTYSSTHTGTPSRPSAYRKTPTLTRQQNRRRAKHSDAYREHLHIVDLCFRLLNEILSHSMRTEKDGWDNWELLLASVRTYSTKSDSGWVDNLGKGLTEANLRLNAEEVGANSRAKDKAADSTVLQRELSEDITGLSDSAMELGDGTGVFSRPATPGIAGDQSGTAGVPHLAPNLNIEGSRSSTPSWAGESQAQAQKSDRNSNANGDTDANAKANTDPKPKSIPNQIPNPNIGMGIGMGGSVGVGDAMRQDSLKEMYESHCAIVWHERLTHVEATLLCDMLLLYETELAAWRNDEKSSNVSEQVQKTANQVLVHNLLAVILTYCTEILPVNEARDTIDVTKQTALVQSDALESARRRALHTPMYEKRSAHDNEMADFAFGAGDETSDERAPTANDEDLDDLVDERRNTAHEKMGTAQRRLHFIAAFHNLAMAHRFMDVIDVLVFGSTLPLGPIEKRFEWKSGGVLRLSLRLVCFTASHTNDKGLGARALGTSQLRALSRAILTAPASYNRVSSAASECEAVHVNCREQEGARVSADPLMRPLMVEKDFLRLRAVLYRDFDDYIANAQRLVLIVLRFVTRLVLDRYMHLLGVQGSSTAFTRTTSLGSLGYHGNQAASPPAMSVYFSAAFPRALHLFRELVSDFHSYLAKNLLTSHKRSVVTSADSLFKTKGTESGSSAATEDESINTAIIMFMCSTDWLDAIRMQADPEWTQTTEEVAKTWERLSERLHAHATANNKVQSGQVNRRVHVNMAFEAFFVRCRERLMRRKGWGQKQRIEMAVALRLWLQLTDKLRYSLGNTRAIGNKSEGYWKLDTHEDLLRRRMRMVPNHAGSSHPEAILRKKGDSADRQADEHTGEDKSYDAPSRGPVLPKGIKVARDFKGVRWGKVGDPQQQSTEDVYQQRVSTEDFALDELYQVDHAPELYLNEIYDENASNESLAEKSLGSTLAHVDSARQLTTLTGLSLANMMAKQLPTMADIASLARAGIVAATTKKITCDIVTPGLTCSGTLKLTSSAFSVTVNMDDLQVEGDSKYMAYIDSIGGTWPYNLVEAVYPRRHMLRTTAVEIFLTNQKPLMFVFSNSDDLATVIRALPASWLGIGRKGFLGLRSDLRSAPEIFAIADITKRWQQRQMTNFEYLMRINTLSGRTYNDLNQYPVFPWVLSNYTSEILDLSDPANYRDLSKPVGALNETRLKSFVERYDMWDDPDTPAFHYGSHYSTGGYVLTWLIRIEPFSTLFLDLQGGKFDHPERMFSCVQRAWNNCLTSTTDVRELIPEMFYLPELLINSNNYDLGTMEDGRPLRDVELPPWANGDPYTFMRIHREALESDYVSANLHLWIDLVFGYKQLGDEAVKAHNVFYPLTYEGAVDVTTIADPVERMSVEAQIVSFGQTPSQLLSDPHPPRNNVLPGDSSVPRSAATITRTGSKAGAGNESSGDKNRTPNPAGPRRQRTKSESAVAVAEDISNNNNTNNNKNQEHGDQTVSINSNQSESGGNRPRDLHHSLSSSSISNSNPKKNKKRTKTWNHKRLAHLTTAPVAMEMVLRIGNSPIMCLHSKSATLTTGSSVHISGSAATAANSGGAAENISETGQPSSSTDIIVSITNSMCYSIHTLLTTTTTASHASHDRDESYRDPDKGTNKDIHKDTKVSHRTPPPVHKNMTDQAPGSPVSSTGKQLGNSPLSGTRGTPNRTKSQRYEGGSSVGIGKPTLHKQQSNQSNPPSSPVSGRKFKRVMSVDGVGVGGEHSSSFRGTVGLGKSTPRYMGYKPTFTLDPALAQADYAAQRRVGANIRMRAHQSLSRQCFAVIGDRRYIQSKQTAAVLWTCGSWDGSFQCYSLNYLGGARLLQNVRVHTDGVTCLTLSDNHEILLTGSKDTTVMVWKLVPGTSKIHRQPQAVIYEHSEPIRCLAVDKNHDLVASGSDKIFLHTCVGDLIRVLEHPTCDKVVMLRITPDCRVIAYYEDHGGTIAVYTINGHLLKTLAIDEKLGDACVSQDGRYLVTGGNNGCVVVRLVDNLSIIHVYEAMAPAIRSLAISSCERWIYAGADDGALTLYKTAMPHWHMVALTRLS